MINFLKIIFFLAILSVSVFLLDGKNTQIFATQAFAVQAAAVFISGFFYTSFLTAPLSVILLVALAPLLNPYLLTAIAGAGAVMGDLLIIKFFRTVFSVFSFVRHRNSFKHLKKRLQRYRLDIIAYILGGLIIASPFPDELGLILLGTSKLSYFKLAVLTFLLNGTGILIIVLTVRAIR